MVNIVSYGGGTNSTAMLIMMVREKIPIDLVMFADTGGERPETYEYVRMFSGWLVANAAKEIAIVNYTNKHGNKQTLEDECLKSNTLPAIAYGYKKCSLKYKRGVQDKYCNNHAQCKAEWKAGRKVNRYIGFDAGEPQRKQNAIVSDMLDKKYEYRYPLIDDWDLDRDGCIEVIQSAGLSLPGKSSCFFCPSMKKPEILELRRDYPDLLERALAIEDNAKPNLQTVAGLGRNYAWRDYLDGKDSQTMFCGMLTDLDTPCGCYDG